MFKGSPVHIFPFLMYFNPLKQDLLRARWTCLWLHDTDTLQPTLKINSII